MFQSIASEHGLTVQADNNGETFNTLAALQQFGAIVFSNTSGDALFSADQRANFEAYMAGGGRVMGLHAATDTYRHSSANGSNTGTWDYYAELIGASVQQNPNHVDGTPLYDLSHVGTHASTADLPAPWSKNEEYYYWEGGYYRTDNIPVLEVEETLGPNGQVNSYDAPRPMSWYRELAEGGRVFYTALGHAPSNFTSDALFRQHIEDALLWLLQGPLGTASLFKDEAPVIFPQPADDHLRIPALANTRLRVCDPQGRVLLTKSVAADGTVEVAELPSGIYALQASKYSLRFVIAR